MRIKPTRLAAVALLAFAAALTGFLVNQLVTAGDGSRSFRNMVKSDDRDVLSLCVDRADGSDVTEQEMAAVTDGVRAALAVGAVPELRGVEPRVSPGCPPPLALTGEPIDYLTSQLEIPFRYVNAGEVSSPHRYFVYFVPDDVYKATFVDDPPYAHVGAEVRCGGDVCDAVTEAVYVPSGTSAGLFEEAALDLLGLRGPPPPEPTLDWGACARGTPKPYCGRFDECAVPYPDPSCEDFWGMTGLEPPQ